MNEYVLRVSRDRMTWDGVRALGAAVDHDNAVMERWLLRSSDNPNWLTRQAAKGLSYLMKALSGLPSAAGLVGVVAFTAIDLFVAMLASNMSKMAELDDDICEAMRQAAGWAGIVIKGAAQITAQVVKAILETMMRVLKLVGMDDDEDLDAPLDIARYLARVEDARPALQARIADCFARAELGALEAALATLPADRPPLTDTLAPDAFTRWLELYEAHHEGLEAAVAGIRQLEPVLAG